MCERAADLQIQPIHWHWKGWLALGKFEILAGTKATGKSTTAVSLAATTTVGGLWPDGTQAAPGDALIWSAEDNAEDTILPRFAAAGGDFKRLIVVRSTRLRNDETVPFDPSLDLPALAAGALQRPELKMIILDPVVMAVGDDVDSHRNAETRRGLQPLVDLAEKLHVVVLGLTHFSKGTSELDPLDRVTGSLAFTAIARIVLGCWVDNQTGERRLVRIASNIGISGGGYGYELYEAPLPDRGIGALHLRWGNALHGPAAELLRPAKPDTPTALDEAVEFLREYLGSGPKPVLDVKEAAGAHFHSWGTIRRAQQQLGIKPTKVGLDMWIWALPEPPERGFGYRPD
jgi:putative DNA primase/helicase